MKDKNIPASYAVNGNVNPFVPSGWKVERHARNGLIADFNSSKIDLFQHHDGIVRFRDELANATLLDCFLRHPEMIPDEWKKDRLRKSRVILFCGTTYIGLIKSPRYKQIYSVRYVRGLIFNSRSDEWGWTAIPLGRWKGNGYVATLNSR